MKLELRNLKISLHLSEATVAFTADIYVDGIKTGFAKNNGSGGSTSYFHYEGKKSLLQEAESFCLTLPPRQYPAYQGMEAFEVDMNLENFIEKCVDEEVRKRELAREKKALEKRMICSVMWGVPNGETYREVKFPLPLDKIPLNKLQPLIDEYKKRFKEGDVFLNTNLEKLGVKI